ncbi:hypothetical protein [Corynebacterium sp. NML130628]|uniref:hypothetical protein n=1 Tax=Corynebacterium sp. NML130628 TaxID=1906333 RepID=UPI0008FAE633|nr:hypothetical protein [Corynebacterium sp. NML130628]OIR40285.1 hypothetical protein BJP07_10070 [Corynebacterium sp. NML130628]
MVTSDVVEQGVQRFSQSVAAAPGLEGPERDELQALAREVIRELQATRCQDLGGFRQVGASLSAFNCDAVGYRFSLKSPCRDTPGSREWFEQIGVGPRERCSADTEKRHFARLNELGSSITSCCCTIDDVKKTSNLAVEQFVILAHSHLEMLAKLGIATLIRPLVQVVVEAMRQASQTAKECNVAVSECLDAIAVCVEEAQQPCSLPPGGKPVGTAAAAASAAAASAATAGAGVSAPPAAPEPAPAPPTPPQPCERLISLGNAGTQSASAALAGAAGLNVAFNFDVDVHVNAPIEAMTRDVAAAFAPSQAQCFTGTFAQTGAAVVIESINVFAANIDAAWQCATETVGAACDVAEPAPAPEPAPEPAPVPEPAPAPKVDANGVFVPPEQLGQVEQPPVPAEKQAMTAPAAAEASSEQHTEQQSEDTRSTDAWGVKKLGEW